MNYEVKNERPDYRQRQRIRKRLKVLGEPCAICGRLIDYSLEYWIDPKDGKRKRHPLSFEYDHVIPHSLGGSNSFDNARAVHRICNQKRQNKINYKLGNKKLTRRPTKPKTSKEW